jgi:phosphoacetylglucosamine mutase
LNFGCGADYVKTTQSASEGLKSLNDARCVAVDGDADRVVYFFQKDGKFNLLDGDKIATLIAGYIGELVKLSGLEKDIKLGLVQTAYANGSSTDYIVNKLGVPVACAPTGVKHLHHKALEYDIGVYFEANGHGTVIFSDKAEKLIRATESASKLQLLIDVINQTVGDAISDMLLVECILAARGWSAGDWSEQYKDLPNKLMKVIMASKLTGHIF